MCQVNRMLGQATNLAINANFYDDQAYVMQLFKGLTVSHFIFISS